MANMFTAIITLPINNFDSAITFYSHKTKQFLSITTSIQVDLSHGKEVNLTQIVEDPK